MKTKNNNISDLGISSSVDLFKSDVNSLIQTLLSPKEREVLYLWVCGYTAKDIAKLCNAKYYTTQTHLTRIRYKFNVNNLLVIKTAVEKAGLKVHCLEIVKNLVDSYSNNKIRPSIPFSVS